MSSDAKLQTQPKYYVLKFSLRSFKHDLNDFRILKKNEFYPNDLSMVSLDAKLLSHISFFKICLF